MSEQAIPSSGAELEALESMLNVYFHGESANRLKSVLLSLAKNDQTWNIAVDRVRDKHFSGSYSFGAMGKVLDTTADCALIRLSAGRFVLIARHGEYWRLVDANGIPSQIIASTARDYVVEAILFNKPAETRKNFSLSSASSLFGFVKTAWAEIGFASFYVNSGQLLLPLFSMLVYDKVVHNGVFETLWTLAIGMMIYLFTDVGMRVLRAMTIERLAQKMSCDADEALWSRLLTQHDSHFGYAKFLSHYRDLALSRDFVSSSYLLLILDIPFFFLYLLALIFIAWPLAIALVILVVLYTGIGYVLQNKINRLSIHAEHHATSKLALMGEFLSSQDLLRTSPLLGGLLRRWRLNYEETSKLEASKRLFLGYTTTLSANMVTFTTIVILVSGVYLIEARSLSVGGLIASNLLASRAMALVTSLFMVIGKFKDYQRAAARVESSFEKPEDKTYVSRPTVKGQLSINKLTKKFHDRPTALDEVSLVFNAGERVAILGRPGAGKTTLMRCIAGLCKADSGTILIDGLALDDVSREDRAKWQTWKSQEPVIFMGTLEENLAVSGALPASETLQKAIWASGLEDELSSGRMTLGMKLEERGANLSGGQRQKVALARAFAQGGQIILLDEPTLGLDPDSERLLASRLPQVISPEATLIVTTHSSIFLSVINRVIAIDAGKIVADGAKEKLIVNN